MNINNKKKLLFMLYWYYNIYQIYIIMLINKQTNNIFDKLYIEMKMRIPSKELIAPELRYQLLYK